MLSGRQAIVLAVVQVMQDLVNRCREALLYVRGCQPRQLGRHLFLKLGSLSQTWNAADSPRDRSGLAMLHAQGLCGCTRPCG